MSLSVSKVVNFFHKASSYLAVAAALAAQASSVAAPVTTWPGLILALAGALATPAVLGNLAGKDKQ